MCTRRSARVQQLTPGLDALVEDRRDSSYESLATLVPPRAAQERALTWLAAHRELTDPARVTRELNTALEAVGLVPQAFAPGLATLDEALRPEGPVSLEVWQGTPVRAVHPALAAPQGRHGDHRHQRLRTARAVAAPRSPRAGQARAGVPGASLTGVNLVSQRLRETVWQDAGVAGLLGLVLVLGLLLWDSHSLKSALICLLPVVTGVLWALGVMAVAGYPLNLLNVFVITMVIGVGSDYAIYMIHRVREGSGTEQLAQTARAVVLSALTTVVGFGTLITTHYPGLQSMGWMASLGVLFACFTAVVLVPLVAGRTKAS